MRSDAEVLRELVEWYREIHDAPEHSRPSVQRQVQVGDPLEEGAGWEWVSEPLALPVTGTEVDQLAGAVDRLAALGPTPYADVLSDAQRERVAQIVAEHRKRVAAIPPIEAAMAAQRDADEINEILEREGVEDAGEDGQHG
jgi:hypothetical protein